jgi:dTDP-4-dehydro-6-deoxy-alpha-D-glucopyranose 2,3-dehydratase
MNNKYHLFLKSSVNIGSEHVDTEKAIEWLEQKKNKANVSVTRCPLKKTDGWEFSSDDGVIKHNTGKFFSIEGIKINSNCLKKHNIYQPIINQPEIGYLGILTKEINGVLHFLLQAKIEPGNVNFVQLSPTLQATRSNYTKVHKGLKPLYLEYFQDKEANILLDQLQSEQGSRFLHKRNRNIIILVNDDIIHDDNFIWLTLNQIKSLMRFDNIVNMDTRSVIACVDFGVLDDNCIDLVSFLIKKNTANKEHRPELLLSLLSTKGHLHTVDHLISFIAEIKSECDLFVEKTKLSHLDGWVIDEMEIIHFENKYFKVIATDVEIEHREVVKWSQPMIESMMQGLCAFVAKPINGVLHFLVQAKIEPGNLDIIELAPTVQYLSDDYSDDGYPFLRDYVLNAENNKIVFDTIQSEEGGRFFQDQNRYMLIITDDDISDKLPERYIWMTLNQINFFMKFNNYMNIQARSLIAAIPFV